MLWIGLQCVIVVILIILIYFSHIIDINYSLFPSNIKVKVTRNIKCASFSSSIHQTYYTVIDFSEVNIIQLLTNEVLDMV